MKRALLVIPLIAFAGCGFFGHHTQRYEPPGIAAIGQPATGQELFARDCAWCHGNQGEGTERAPSLTTGFNGAALTDFMLRTGRMPIQDANQIIRERAPQYPSAVIDKIVAYVASLGGPGPAVPHPDVAAGVPSQGEELFQSNCAACHSAGGIGGTLTQQGQQPAQRRTAGQIPGLRQATPREIAEAMRTGPGTMPVFGSENFSDQDVDSIIAYIVAQRNADRGGANLGRIGPVAEGAVAWVFGLGALLLLSRWIGKTVTKE